MNQAEAVSLLPGTGEMADRTRAFDWSRTPVGSIDNWPLSLRLAVGTMLECPTPMAIAWGEQHTLFYNDGYRMFLGSTKHPGALGGAAADTWAEVWIQTRQMWDSARQGRPVNFQNARYVIERDGIARDAYFDFSCSPVRDESGRALGILAVALETTGRVNHEALLLQEQQKMQALFMQAPAAVAILQGPELRFSLANIRYGQLVNKAESHLIGQPLAQVFPELPPQVTSVLRGVMETGERFVASEWPVALDWSSKGDVHERFVNLIYEPLRNTGGDVEGIMVFAFDVSEQVMARRRAETAHVCNQFAIEAAGMGVWQLDLETGAAERSLRHDQCFGHETMLPSWTYEDFHARVLPSYREHIDQLFRTSIASGSDWRFECPIVWPDKSVHWIASRARVDVDAKGKPVQLFGLVWDITESRAIQETLSEANRQKDEFLSTLAHELRNPLAPIRNAAYVLGQPAVSSSKVAWCHEVITRQSSHMALLLDDLLDVSRVSAGHVELKKSTVSLRSVIQSAVDAVSPLIERKKHRLHLNLPADGIEVHVDPLRLAQVFSNLLTNAAKYTDEGGTIELEAVRHEQGLSLFVRDNGIGVEAGALPRLFQMFSQVLSPVDRSEGGLGIGLALSKGLVELHGGTLRACSEGLGLGTTLEVHLPLEAVHSHGVDASPPAVPAPGHTAVKVVLVVDDNQDAADSLAMLLELEGHDVSVAYGAHQALSIGLLRKPDMIILDIGMPEMNGYELARRIRQEAWGRGAVLVAATGWGQEDDQRKAREAGFDRHLTKPVNPSDVIALLAGATLR
jgi:signal transduction histidine kinase